MNLSGHLQKARLSFVDAMSLVAPALETPSKVSLRKMYDHIRDALQLAKEGQVNTLVILDDLATLEWIGVTVEELARFSRALCALCRQVCRSGFSWADTYNIWQRNAALVLRHHVVTPGEPDEVFRRLLQLCDYHLDVFPLSSGRSGSVSGQVSATL